MGDSKRWSAADFAAVAWVALHVYASVQSFRHGLYQTYTGRTWALLTIWLLGLLALDAWLSAGRPGLLRFAKWYWGFSAALATGVILAVELDLIRDVNGFLVFAVLCSFLTPLNQLLAFTWLLFKELAGLSGIVRYGAGCGGYCFSASSISCTSPGSTTVPKGNITDEKKTVRFSSLRPSPVHTAHRLCPVDN